MVELIIDDLRRFWELYALDAAVAGVTAAVVIAIIDLVRVIYEKIRRRSYITLGKYIKDVFTFALFFSYLCMMLGIVFLSREDGAGYPVNLKLFGTWGQTPSTQRYFIENILLFVPFGVLFPALGRWTSKWYICFFIGSGCSLFIECMQLYTGRGRFELDDIITNTLGCIVGFIGYQFIRLMGRIVRKK